MNKEEAINFINQQEFREAKSYSDTFPHWYLSRQKTTDTIKYEEFLHYIRKNGETYHFYNKQYIYLFLNNFVYWEMGRPIKCVQVLNKAEEGRMLNYNQAKASEEIDKTLKQKLSIREEYLDELLKINNKTEKDLMQIKFLMDTQRRIHGGGKNIIDNYKTEIRYE